jgi:hypothetical protein
MILGYQVSGIKIRIQSVLVRFSCAGLMRWSWSDHLINPALEVRASGFALDVIILSGVEGSAEDAC